ncbi:MAG TPA: tryptophan 2,3-dioxygenase [Stellaceae bacterium]|nr:tryptophan 2,3-dioxygenase [Stellaceae bacterium]
MSDHAEPGAGARHEARQAHADFAGDMSYGDYLHLDAVLTAQHPRSGNHNELLFIIQHQTSELWMKLALHELRAARDGVKADDLDPAFKMLARVSRIMHQLIQAWDVLSTLTPSEYHEFRATLGRSSGFQSYQYRLLEFILGNKDRGFLAPHAHRPDIHGELLASLESPSLYDEAIRLLGRRGFAIDAAATQRDWSLPYRADASVAAAWTEVYRDTDEHWDLYELAEKLVDLEDYFRQWRFRHVTTVERIIGLKPGTGGTSGVAYLRHLLEVRLFPELWDLRTVL